MNEELLELKNDTKKKKALLEKAIMLKDKCIVELKGNINLLNELRNTIVKQKDRIIERLKMR